jgi:hypothetical protein
MLQKLFCSIIILLFVSCSSNNKESNQSLTTIHVEHNKAKSIKFYELFDKTSTSYIQLERKSDFIIGQINQMKVLSDRILLLSKSVLYVFDLKGKYMHQINKRGKSPDEYLSAIDVVYDNGTYLLLDQRKNQIHRYTEQAKLLESYDIGIYGMSFTKINKDLLAIFIGSFKNENSDFRLNYYSLKEKKIVNKYKLITDKEYKWMNFWEQDNFSSGNLFSYQCNDTVYRISKNQITPKFKLDFGKHTLTSKQLNQSYSDVMDFSEKNQHKYIYTVFSKFETINHFSFGYRFQEKFHYSIYSKSTNKITLVNEIENPFGIPTQCNLDFNLIPRYSDGEYLYFVIEPGAIEDYSEDKTKLPSYLKNFNENSNPIIVKTKLKC